jgi:hypothetical protein
MRKLLVLAAVALFLVPAAYAQDNGTISGTVQGELNGSIVPLPRAHVAVFPINGDHPMADAVTDSLGFYHVRIPFGRYQVRAEKMAFVAEWFDNAFHRADATTVPVTEDSSPNNINFVLGPGQPPPPPPPTTFGSISGAVIDSVTNLPLEGVQVLAYSGNNWPRMARTGADGTYLLDSLRAGTYHLVAHMLGYVPEEYPDRIVIDSVQVTGINFALIPFEETGISGTITDAVTGAPIGRAMIVAINVENRFVRFYGRTLENGTYFVHARAGEYLVAAYAMGYWRMEYPQHVTVVQSDITENINFALNAINFGSIAGVVTDSAGVPVPMAMVVARKLGGDFGRQARTDSTGAYLMEDVMPGTYRVVAFHRAYGPGAYPDSVVVAEGQDVTGINIVLGVMLPPNDGHIAGLITDDSTGAPIANAMVMAIGRTNQFGRHHFIFRRAFSDSLGNYSIENLPRIPLKVFAAARGYLGEFYDNVHRFSEATPVTPDAENINFALGIGSFGPRSIAGRIYMPAGYETDGLFVYATVDGQIVDVIDADPMGYYNIGSLEPGTYELSVSSLYGDMAFDYPVNVTNSDARADIEFNVTSADDGQQLPMATSLAQNYPNPFNARTMISFNLSEPGNVELSVYNIVGQKVATLVNGEYNAGSYNIAWDGTDSSGKVVSSGIYYYRLAANGETETMKMTLLK